MRTRFLHRFGLVRPFGQGVPTGRMIVSMVTDAGGVLVTTRTPHGLADGQFVDFTGTSAGTYDNTGGVEVSGATATTFVAILVFTANAAGGTWWFPAL